MDISLWQTQTSAKNYYISSLSEKYVKLFKNYDLIHLTSKLTSSCEILEHCLKIFEKDDYYLENAFLTACKFNNNLEIIKYFLKNQKINLKFTKYHLDYMFEACRFSENLDIIKYLLSIYENVNNINSLGENLALMACWNNNFEIFKYLTKNYNININQITLQGLNAFNYVDRLI